MLIFFIFLFFFFFFLLFKKKNIYKYIISTLTPILRTVLICYDILAFLQNNLRFYNKDQCYFSISPFTSLPLTDKLELVGKLK